MSEKMEPCCARLVGRLHSDQNNLRTLARRAAYADQKGRDITKFRRLIEEAKAAIANDEANLAQHEADHAGVVA